jgi:hypothetical protein
MLSYACNYKFTLVGGNAIICLLTPLYYEGYIKYSILLIYDLVNIGCGIVC